MRVTKYERQRMEVSIGVERAAVEIDTPALDEINLLLSAPEWPGASGMEDVCEIVRGTGREEIPDAPDWESH